MLTDNQNDSLIRLFDDFIATLDDECPENFESLKRKLGISRIAKINGLADIDTPVFIAIRPDAKYISVSSGKGLGTAEALISTLMETAESDALENKYRYDMKGSYHDLCKTHKLLNPQKIHTGFFDHAHILDTELHWLEGVNLVDNTPILAPCESIFFDKKTLISDYFTLTSNGVAASFSETYAINHAIFELIERHQLTCWQNQLASGAVENVLIDLHAIPNKVKKLVDYLEAKGFDVFLWDINAPQIQVPCFQAALLLRGEFFVNSLFTGSAAHVDSETAMIKAILETIQSRAGYISGSRDDIMPDYYKRDFSAINEEVIKTLPRLPKSQFFPEEKQAMSLAEINHFLMTRLKLIGVTECIALKLSDDPVPVFKIIIPDFLYNFRRM